jgi:hypothetical protein
MSDCIRIRVIIEGYKKSFPTKGYTFVKSVIDQFPKEFLIDIENYLIKTNQSEVKVTFRLGEKELSKKKDYMDFHLLSPKSNDEERDSDLPF